jgi:hypothetical protein
LTGAARSWEDEMKKRVRRIIGKLKYLITLYRCKNWRKMAGFLHREEHGKLRVC